MTWKQAILRYKNESIPKKIKYLNFEIFKKGFYDMTSNCNPLKGRLLQILFSYRIGYDLLNVQRLCCWLQC